MYRLCSEKVLPMNAMDYAARVEEEVQLLNATHGEEMAAQGIQFESITNHVNMFKLAAKDLHAALETAGTGTGQGTGPGNGTGGEARFEFVFQSHENPTGYTLGEKVELNLLAMAVQDCHATHYLGG